jgi:ribosomal 50S subunit-recycling heat shock protein
MRLDKWLWAARFFKTRSIAARACELGRIQSNGQPAKASRDIRAGDLLEVTTEGGIFQVEVHLLIETGGPAAVAQTMYQLRQRGINPVWVSEHHICRCSRANAVHLSVQPKPAATTRSRLGGGGELRGELISQADDASG